jgi:AraC-like DNA-binding protein
MEHVSTYLTPEIKLSCYEDHFFKSDVVFDHHMLIWFISGHTKLVQADGVHHFQTGDIFLVPRQQPATILNYPKDGLPHQTVVMTLTTDFLRAFYRGLAVHMVGPVTPKIRCFRQHPLLESCLASLVPYFALQEPFPPELASLKLTEAVSILRLIAPELDGLLAHFDDPHKVDLIRFMERNYMFNLPAETFGHLTGRSLTTFKRDFKKAFHTTPHRWLTHKRLELAHYQLAEQGKKPTDVCYETGFENLSHFSYAFKKQFGYSPAHLLAPKGRA